VVSGYHKVSLIGLNERAKKIIDYYKNQLLLQEYDEYGRPLNRKDEKPAIFCVSPDNFWHGWFILDADVRFSEEANNIKKSLDVLKKTPPVL